MLQVMMSNLLQDCRNNQIMKLYSTVLLLRMKVPLSRYLQELGNLHCLQWYTQKMKYSKLMARINFGTLKIIWIIYSIMIYKITLLTKTQRFYWEFKVGKDMPLLKSTKENSKRGSQVQMIMTRKNKDSSVYAFICFKI